MISTLKRCLIFLALFVFGPVQAFTNDDSSSVGFLVVILVVIFLIILVCRCIDNENESEMLVEPYRGNERNVVPVPSHYNPVRAESNLRAYVPYVPGKSSVRSALFALTNFTFIPKPNNRPCRLPSHPDQVTETRRSLRIRRTKRNQLTTNRHPTTRSSSMKTPSSSDRTYRDIEKIPKFTSMLNSSNGSC